MPFWVRIIGEYNEAAVVTFLFQFGSFLEQKTMGKTRSAIKALTAAQVCLIRRVSSLEKQGLLLKKGRTSRFWIPTPLPKCSGKNKRRAFFTVFYCKSIRAHPFFRHYYPKIAPEIWHRNAKYPIALFPFLRYNVTGRKGFFLRIFVQSRHILCSFLSYIGSRLSISGVDMQAAGFFTRRNYKCWKN